MYTIEIPSHEECSEISIKERTALHEFVYENEPADLIQSEKFRATLKAVMREVSIKVIDELLQYPDQLTDAINNENSDWYRLVWRSHIR